VLQTSKPIRNGTDTVINSYDGHVFVVKFYKSKIEDEGEFAKLDVSEETFVTYDPSTGFKVTQRTKMDEMTEKIDEALSICDEYENKAECVADRVLADIIRAEKAHETAKRYSNKMAARLRNYTCADPLMSSSKPKSTHHMMVDGKNFKIDDMFENDHARIFTVDNFLTEQECDHFIRHGKSRLQRATVAAEDGTSILSNHRRANQATYDSHRSLDDPLQ
jgi:hypothetical protein